jgi:hypothetical protein
MNIKEHMARVRKIEETLSISDCLYLVSLADELRGRVGGRIVQVPRANAAVLIENGAFRLATDDEIATQEAIDEQKREQARFVKMNPATQHYAGNCIVLEPKKKTGR